MSEMYHAMLAVLGVAGLFGLWLGVQALARRQAGDVCDEEPDSLACGACEHKDPQCSIERGTAQQPEQAGRCRMRMVETDPE